VDEATATREDILCGGEIFAFALQPLRTSDDVNEDIPASGRVQQPLGPADSPYQTSHRSPVVVAVQKERENGRDDYVLVVFERNADGATPFCIIEKSHLQRQESAAVCSHINEMQFLYVAWII
jgi:hypothetical protein